MTQNESRMVWSHQEAHSEIFRGQAVPLKQPGVCQLGHVVGHISVLRMWFRVAPSYSDLALVSEVKFPPVLAAKD